MGKNNIKIFWLSFLFAIIFGPVFAEETLQQLKTTQKSLEDTLKKAKQQDTLSLALRVNSEWVIVPVKMSELNNMMSTWISQKKMTVQEAMAAKQDLTDFTIAYQQSLEQKLNEVKKKIQAASHPKTKAKTSTAATHNKGQGTKGKQ